MKGRRQQTIMRHLYSRGPRSDVALCTARLLTLTCGFQKLSNHLQLDIGHPINKTLFGRTPESEKMLMRDPRKLRFLDINVETGLKTVVEEDLRRRL